MAEEDRGAAPAAEDGGGSGDLAATKLGWGELHWQSRNWRRSLFLIQDGTFFSEMLVVVSALLEAKWTDVAPARRRRR